MPTGLTASDGTYTNKVSLSWNDVTGETGYQVYRSTANNSATAAVAGLAGCQCDEFRRHHARRRAPPITTGCGPWHSASGTYYYSSFSTPDTGYALPTTPPVPTGLTASDGTYTNKVSLSWNDVTGETGYQVYRSTTNNSATAAWLCLLGANATSFDDTSAVPGTTYYYWVRALVLVSGTYYYSNFSTPDTGYALAIPPPVPTGLTASDGTYTNKVSLSWNDVTGETGYQVYRSTVNNSATAQWLCLLGANATSFDDTTAAPGTTYYYWVRALAWFPGLTTTATSARPTRATPCRSRRRSPRA